MASYTGENVTKIDACFKNPKQQGNQIVAAYCRVSTDDIGQIISIEMQKLNYRKLIKETPGWTFYGMYVDDGFSGTNTTHRPGFQKMMQDALEGKFQIIITKSVSRFARNLLDCLAWVRKLKEIGVAVIFEDVKLNTLDKASDLILVVLALVAEEESHMKSEAMQLSLEWRFSRGRFMIPKLLGYESVKGADGKKTLVIVPEEEKTVKLMYFMLLNGDSPEEIARTLTELQRSTGSGRTVWTASGVVATLRNERYCGDILARKTFTPNFLDHKSKRNRGEKNRYYQSGHHEAIVSRTQWNAAQKILNSRRYGHKSGFLPLRIIPQGSLKGYLSINRSWAGADMEEYYRVSSIAMGLMTGDLETDLENEYLPDRGNELSGLSDGEGIQRIVRQLTEEEEKMKAELEGIAMDEEDFPMTMTSGFQVVRGDLFSHVYEPVLRVDQNHIAFNTSCVSRLKRQSQTGQDLPCETVELLLNPVERMLVVRPCDPLDPNAIRWCDTEGRGRTLGATAFCNMMYSLMDWEQGYAYSIPASVRQENQDIVLFFDLDHYIGKKRKKEGQNQKTVKEAIPEEPTSDQAIRQSQKLEGHFLSADDDEEVNLQKEEEIAALEAKMEKMREIDRRTFGRSIHSDQQDSRNSIMNQEEIRGLMEKAVEISSDYRVDHNRIEDIQLEMLLQLEEQATNEEEPHAGGGEITYAEE